MIGKTSDFFMNNQLKCLFFDNELNEKDLEGNIALSSLLEEVI